MRHGSFDLVATNKTTHHIPNRLDAVTEMVRVLAPAGHLIYADLVLPDWAARIGSTLAPGRAGYPTREALDRVLGSKLQVVHLARSAAH